MNKKRAPGGPWIEWGVATRALPGQAESGDRHLVQRFPDGVLAAVVDGLGHGPTDRPSQAHSDDTKRRDRRSPGSQPYP